MFDLGEELATIIYKALNVEDSGDRSKAKIYLEQGKLMLVIEADNLTALRASINTWLRLVKVCKDVVEVLE